MTAGTGITIHARSLVESGVRGTDSIGLVSLAGNCRPVSTGDGSGLFNVIEAFVLLVSDSEISSPK